IAVILILIGGIVTISKAFLFGAVLFFCSLIFFTKKKLVIPMLMFIVVLILSYFTLINSNLSNSWSGYNRFTTLISGGTEDKGLIWTLSGGRFSDSGKGTIEA